MNLSDQIKLVLASRSWGLIDQANPHVWNAVTKEVAALTGQIDATQPVDATCLDRAVIGAYCPILHAACSDDGSERQRRAFEELWQWIYPRVRQRVDTAEDAEDAAQQVMVKVYPNLYQVTDPRGFLAWVNKITFRTLSSYYRRQGRGGQFEELSIDAAEDTGAMDELIGTEDVLEKELSLVEEELVRMIYQCMPPRQHRRVEVLVALVFREMTVAEVARHMNTSQNSVYGLYFHAKEGLLEHCRELVEMLIQRLTPSQREKLGLDQ